MLYMALAALARFHGRRLSWRDIATRSTQTGDAALPEAAAVALQSHGFAVQVFQCVSIDDLRELPVALRMKDGSWALLCERGPADAKVQMFSATQADSTQSSAEHKSQKLQPIAPALDDIQQWDLERLRAACDGLVIAATPSFGATSASQQGAQAQPGQAQLPSLALDRHWFWGVFNKLRSHYGDCVIAAVLINLLGLAGSMFAMNVYDRVIPNAAMHSLWALAIGVFLAAILELGLRSLRAHVLDDAGKRADLVISSDIYRQTLALRPDQRPASSGQWAGQLREFESVREFVSSSTLVALTDLPFALLFFGVLIWMGGSLVWVTVIAAVLIIALGALTQWPIRQSVEQYQYENTQKHAYLIESIERLETIEALGAASGFQGRWERVCAAAARSALVSRTASALTMNASQWLQQTASTLLIVVGVYFILAGQLTVGALIGCSILAGRALTPLAQIAGLMARWQHTRTAFVAVDKLMQLPTARTGSKDHVSLEKWRGELTLSQLEFAFPRTNKAVLHIPALRMNKGEVIAIMGPVGSGKSTLLRILAGLQAPTSGQLLVDGLDVEQLSPADWRAQVAWLSQDPVLFRGTLRENLLIANPSVSDERFVHVLNVCGLTPLIQQHPQGLDMPLGESGQALSGGQRQLVALARALLSEASILLFDEPTSAMDMQGEHALLQRLRPEFEGRLVVFVTHRTGPLEVVDRLLLLDQGRLVADGPRDEVLKALQAGRVSRATHADQQADTPIARAA
jgi:ATP-binding cassette, subfamily C, bacterial LapB